MIKPGTRSNPRSRRFPLATPLLAATAASLSCGALGAPLFTEEDLLSEIPLVSAVSRFEQRLDRAPASVTLITSDMIEMSGAQTIVDIFRLVPGFQSYYVSRNRYGISYHGIGREFPNQIEVMVDGRSVYETLFSSVNWSTLGIGLADIDHIEVVRGSNAAAQGSNAFMGSINIVTRKPIQENGVRVSFTGGDLQTRRASAVTAGSFGPVQARLSLGYDRNDGFPAVPEGPLEDGRELTYGNLRTTYTPTLSDTVDVFLGYAHERLGWGDSDHPDDYSLAHSFSNFQSATWTRTAEDGDEYELHVYHNKFKTSNFTNKGPAYNLLGLDADTAAALTAVTPTPPAIIDLFSQLSGLNYGASARVINVLNAEIHGGFGRLSSERYDIQLEHDFHLDDQFRGTWGVGARLDELDSYHPQNFTNDINETSYRLYSHNEWRPLPAWTLNAGAMLEDTHVGTLFSPRASVSYQFLDHHDVRLAYARGNRAPSLLEANETSVARVEDVVYDILRIANPALHEERIDSYELAYMYRRPQLGLSLDLRLFREEIDDVIDEVRDFVPAETAAFGDTSLKRLENRDAWELNGGELQLHYQLTPATLLRLNYTYTDFDPDIAPPNPGFIQVNKDDRVAQNTVGLLLHHDFDAHWSASLTGFHQSGLRWEDGDTIDAIDRVDGRISYGFELGGTEGKVSLVVQNIGREYSEFNDNNRFATLYFLTASLELPN